MVKQKKPLPRKQKTAKAGKQRATLPTILWVAGILLGLGFVVLAVQGTPFLQDDAYISFRYVNNYLAGDGLVFNAGERVEGYTNFLWVIILVLAAKLGFTPIEAARWLGILFSAGAVAGTLLLVRQALTTVSVRWFYAGALAAGLWVAVNPAVEYWSIAGLETGMFLFFVTLDVERVMARSALGWILLALATLTRPEGGLVFTICYMWFMARDPAHIKSSWWQPLLWYAVPLVPFAGFKLVYYGSLFPNPFYAKTGFSVEYWQSGLHYLWLYLQHFGLWGILLIGVVAGLIRSGWKSSLGLLSILWLVYALYVISIGGDVLRAHRFFVPVWPLFAASAICGFILLARKLPRRTVFFWIACAGFVLVAGYQRLYPAEYFDYSRKLETAIVEKMRTVAALVKQTDSRRFSIAVSTIGRLGFDLPRHTVVDMLGLTDSTVARHPETIPGMQTTWKERNFNAGYILSRDPDYILFSTGYKPSAPAERAIFLHSKFRQNYSVMLYPAPHLGRNLAVYKRRGDFAKPDSVWPDLQLANDFNDGLNFMLSDRAAESIEAFHRIRQHGPRDFAQPYHQLSPPSTTFMAS